MPSSKGNSHNIAYNIHIDKLIQAQKIKGVSVIKPCPVELCARDNKLDVFYYDDVKHKFVQ